MSLESTYQLSEKKLYQKGKTIDPQKHYQELADLQKISLSTARKLVQEAVKNPKVTSRELQEQLAVSGVHIHTWTICRHLNEDGIFARMPRKKASSDQ